MTNSRALGYTGLITMIYVSYNFYFFLAALLILYYAVPLRFRWWLLLAGSLLFFYLIDAEGIFVFLATIIGSYLLGLFLGKRHEKLARQRRKEDERRFRIILFTAIVFVVAPLVVTKHGDSILDLVGIARYQNWIVPLGIAFYTLQIVSYLVDVYAGRVKPQKNLGKYALFVSFFPQIVQGPIPRYSELEDQLYAGHRFNEQTFSKGLQLIIWGFFLKLMIADRAGIIVNAVFDQFPSYGGGYVLVAGLLYSVQLYTDFLACVVISQGSAALFGIELQDNFLHPYKSRSIKEFWRRWHMTLSRWLRDYIYIPLGGNRKGKLAKYTNLGITFGVSGLWHGAGPQYLVWGLLHASYQIGGEITAPARERLYQAAKISGDSAVRKWLEVIVTFLLVMIAWIIFRAETLEKGMTMLGSMFTTYNPWIFFDDSLFKLGLDWKEFLLLLISIGILCFVEHKQETVKIRDWILRQHLVVRWSIYLSAIFGIAILGSYGFGFDSQDFIYGGF